MCKLIAEQDNIQDISSFSGKELLRMLKEKYPQSCEQYDDFSLSDGDIAVVLNTLSNISLLDAPSHIIGDAFQAIIGPRIRGDKGQFFTPKELVECMVRIVNPQNQSVIIDPACGTGGFLTEAYTYAKSVDCIDETSIRLIGVDKDRDTIANEGQAQNLVSALEGLGKHNKHLIIYIDVQPGETLWAFLLQELQSRGLSIPVLISIRDEDYNRTPISGKAIQYGIIELALSKEEAARIYSSFTETQPHAEHRTFEEAWQTFGGQGPLIEFVYLLTNNQTLAQRLQDQVDALLREGISDDWLELLQLVCYAGRLGCTVNLVAAKNEIHCSTMHAAIRRLKGEYLIRVVDDNTIEALHPVRAKIVFDALCNQICTDPREVAFKALPCISSQNVRVVLLDYFSNQQYDIKDVQRLSQIKFCDWVGYANAIRSMLWLDAKRYVESNMTFISSLVAKRGKGWLCFLPLDLSGIERSDELIADGIKDLSIFNKVDLQNAIDEVKNSLTSLSINYEATDCFINNSEIPSFLPNTDTERSSFGYALFWMAKRDRKVRLLFKVDEIVTSICAGELQPSADAIRGLFEHPALEESYLAAVDIFVERLIREMQVLTFSVTSDEV